MSEVPTPTEFQAFHRMKSQREHFGKPKKLQPAELKYLSAINTDGLTTNSIKMAYSEELSKRIKQTAVKRTAKSQDGSNPGAGISSMFAKFDQELIDELSTLIQKIDTKDYQWVSEYFYHKAIVSYHFLMNTVKNSTLEEVQTESLKLPEKYDQRIANADKFREKFTRNIREAAVFAKAV